MKFIKSKGLYESGRRKESNNDRMIEFGDFLNKSCQSNQLVVRRLHEIMKEIDGLSDSEKLQEIEELLDFDIRKSRQLSNFRIYHRNSLFPAFDPSSH